MTHMNERCKHIGKDGHRCGSYAFNLYKDDIEQGDLCDVHYWQTKAQRSESSGKPAAWVGLASVDRLTAKYMQDAPDGIEAVIDYIEAKLKELNT